MCVCVCVECVCGGGGMFVCVGEVYGCGCIIIYYYYYHYSRCQAHLPESFQINSKRRRAEILEDCSQWTLLNVQIITIIFTFAVQKHIGVCVEGCGCMSVCIYG